MHSHIDMCGENRLASSAIDIYDFSFVSLARVVQFFSSIKYNSRSLVCLITSEYTRVIFLSFIPKFTTGYGPRSLSSIIQSVITFLSLFSHNVEVFFAASNKIP